MKTHLPLSRRPVVAFTLLELMVVALTLFLLALLVLPNIQHYDGRVRATRIDCVNRLKQVGLAFRLWAGDNGDRYPMYVSVTNGGAMEYVSNGLVAPIFGVMSNELGTPKLLLCRADEERDFATNWNSLSDANVSYFICLTTTNNANPALWLAGDRNLTNGTARVRGVLTVPTNSVVGWTRAMHNLQGNVCSADGSVQQLTAAGLQASFRTQSVSPLRLLMPQ
jgi:type II secretory pathway pseudopilin PulG